MSSSVRRWLAVCGAMLAVALSAAACSSSETTTTTTTAAPAAGTVNASVKEFEISMDPTSLAGPDVTFSISNVGTITHEFVVFKTDLAPDALPTDSEGAVDEEGAGVEHIDEVEDIAAGSTESLDVSLDPGNYVVICNLPDHYSSGMHTALTVS